MKQFLESKDLLQTIVTETDKVGEDARRLTSGLTEAQMNWKPAPDSWSIAQCLEHLAVSGEKFGPYMTNAIARGREKNRVSGPVPYRPSRLGGWLIKQLLPEATRRVPAPRIFRPSDAPAISGTADHFERQQRELLSFVHQARGVDYNKTRLRSPVTALMRYSLADAFVISVVHAQRHLAQARRVSQAPEFPS